MAWHRATSCLGRLRGWLGQVPPAPGDGLWIVPCRAVHTVGMSWPIDVVFVDRRGRVLRIVSALRPGRAACCWRAWGVLELAAGEAARLGWRQGIRVSRRRGSTPMRSGP
ncbi:DUF192 domain-containing protein [Pigmentiphaga daeguensis]|uniref:DUF192 domain-containing protein n=1 Tax=Pigmentiphaga daeguensis TaxID=414049 RepID=UPI0031D64887